MWVCTCISVHEMCTCCSRHAYMCEVVMGDPLTLVTLLTLPERTASPIVHRRCTCAFIPANSNFWFKNTHLPACRGGMWVVNVGGEGSPTPTNER